jgi:hypothetical protein
VSWALTQTAHAARELGDWHQARAHLDEALRTAAEIGNFAPLLHTLPAAALLLADQGELERAVELYALASRHPYVANSRWFEDVAGKQIAAVAVTLPPVEVAAAQERGTSATYGTPRRSWWRSWNTDQQNERIGPLGDERVRSVHSGIRVIDAADSRTWIGPFGMNGSI